MDIALWLAPGAGFFITLLGVICFIAAFIYLVRTLRANIIRDVSTHHQNTSTDPHEADAFLDALDLADLPSAPPVMYTEFAPDMEPEPEPAQLQYQPKYERDPSDIASYERVQLMFDVAPLIIQYWDEDYNLIDYNETAAIFYQMPIKQDKAVNVLEFFTHKETNALWQSYLRWAFEDGFAKFEYSHTHRDHLAYLEVVARRIRVHESHVVVTYTTDITPEKEMLKEKEERAIAEADSQAKSRFLAHMSHEIRTPISAVMGIAEVQLHNNTHSTEAIDAFRHIYNSSNTLTGILNDILDLSKIEAGKLAIVEAEYDLAILIQDVTQMHALVLEHKHLQFIVRVDENLPTTLIGDALRIKQVLNNVLSNSFKYTEQGSVQFTITSQTTSKGIDLLVKVIDTGRGMTPEQVKTLLSEDYVRFNETEEAPGTGLGISIVQNLLALMGATMDVSSTPDIGTRIQLTIPQVVGNNALLGVDIAQGLEQLQLITKSNAPKPTPMPWANILVVDDIPTNLTVATGLLGLFDITPETCLSAKEAIEKITTGKIYDIIFMDHTMPEMDGMEATIILRKLGYTGTIIALTANALVQQRQAFLDNGFDEFLAKPIKTEALQKFLQTYVPVPDNVTPSTSNTQTSEMDDYYRRPEVIKMIQEDFLSTQIHTLKNVTEALEKSDFINAKVLLHTTRNRALLLEDQDLAEVASKLEMDVANEITPTQADLNALAIEINRVVDTIAHSLATT